MSSSIDPRIPVFRELARAMKNGQFSFKQRIEGDDEIAALGSDLLDLASNLEKRLNETRYLSKVVEQINEGIILDEVLTYIYNSFHPIIPYNRIGLSLIDEDGQTVRSFWARSELKIHLKKGYHAPLEGSSLKKILDTGEPRIINDLEAYLGENPDSFSTRKIIGEGIRSSLTCPLIAMGKPIGFLFFSSSKKDTYKEAHVNFFLQLSGHISMVVEKSRLYEQMADLARRLETRNTFIKKLFGRYISDEVVDNLLESPGSMQIGGEKRQVTILMSDIRGFSALSEQLPAEEVMELLNRYLETMVDVIHKYNGVINEILGDALFVIFGAPVARKDHAQIAVACAIEMQLAVDKLNRLFKKERNFKIEMGIAINTGEAIVGNIGSEKRSKYAVVGSQVNLTGRIESYSVGGQVLISESTRKACGKSITVGKRMEFHAKGFRDPVTVYDLKSIAAPYHVSLPQHKEFFVQLQPPLAVEYHLYQGKRPGKNYTEGSIQKLSGNEALVRGPEKVQLHWNIRLRLARNSDYSVEEEVDGKVIEVKSKDQKTFLVRFTFIPSGASELLDRLLTVTADEAGGVIQKP